MCTGSSNKALNRFINLHSKDFIILSRCHLIIIQTLGQHLSLGYCMTDNKTIIQSTQCTVCSRGIWWQILKALYIFSYDKLESHVSSLYLTEIFTCPEITSSLPLLQKAWKGRLRSLRMSVSYGSVNRCKKGSLQESSLGYSLAACKKCQPCLKKDIGRMTNFLV